MLKRTTQKQTYLNELKLFNVSLEHNLGTQLQIVRVR